MKQTIRLKPENYSKTIHESVSSTGDLRGYVEVNVKNTKTGEIEHQENHNLIVYGGREWLLRRIFGKMITNNDFACNSGIKWVGFGCGGGEPGNPLQCGTTMGSDKDLYQPVRIRFDDDSNTTEQSKNYASRVLPNGSVIPGYFKKITNITIKEDHANPYVQDGVTKYPSLIAEMRIELSADDCNGVNYTENGNLISYQDINEVALFISDQDIEDPGAVSSGKYDTVYTDLSQAGEKTFDNGEIIGDGYDSRHNMVEEFTYAEVAGVKFRECLVDIPNNAYRFQIQINKDGNSIWKDIDPNSRGIQLDKIDANKFRVKDDGVQLLYSLDSGSTWSTTVNGHWAYTLEAGESIQNCPVRLVPCGKFTIRANKSTVFTGSEPVNYEIQYRNYYNEPWKTLIAGTFGDSGDNMHSKTIVVYCNAYDTSSNPTTCMISAGGYGTMFRCKQTDKNSDEVTITEMKTEETSYDVKCYVSNTDINKLHIGDFVYSKPDQNFGEYNNIPQSAPLKILNIHVKDGSNDEASYFVIEKMGTEDKTYSGTMPKMTFYTPSTEQPYVMFSRVTLSSIRKSIDREIIIVYRIYV